MPGWNNFGYPIEETRLVTEALASIDGYYGSVYHHNVNSEVWIMYDPNVSSMFAPMVNSLTQLEFGQGYWLSATQEITLFLGVPNASQSFLFAGFELPPTTFYGWVTGTVDITPTVGDTVTAWVNGNLCGQTTVAMLNGELAYAMQVKSESVIPPSNGCGQYGQTVSFQINGVALPNDDHVWSNNVSWEHPLGDMVPTAVSLSHFAGHQSGIIYWLFALIGLSMILLFVLQRKCRMGR